MARRVIESEPTGETFTFDDEWNEADGRVRRILYTLKPSKPVPSHSHPRTAQSFDVLSGRLNVKMNGRVQVLGPGERAKTGAGDIHCQWNEGPDIASVIESYDPPLAIEPFFTILPHAIASANPFKIAVFLADFRAVSAPATVGQRLFIATFAPVGRLLGFGRWYAGLL